MSMRNLRAEDSREAGTCIRIPVMQATLKCWPVLQGTHCTHTSYPIGKLRTITYQNTAYSTHIHVFEVLKTNRRVLRE